MRIPIGDTVKTSEVIDAVVELLATRGQSVAAAEVTIGGTGRINWAAACSWIAEVDADGYDRIRYIVTERTPGHVVVDLVAIQAVGTTAQSE